MSCIRAGHLACAGHPACADHPACASHPADAIEIMDAMNATDAVHAAGALTIILVSFDGGINRHGAFVPCMATHGTEARNRHRIGAESFAQAVDPERAMLCRAARALQPALHRRHATQAPCNHVDRFHAMTKGKILQGRQHERTHGMPRADRLGATDGPRMLRKIAALHAHPEGTCATTTILQLRADLLEAGLHSLAERLDLRAWAIEDDLPLHLGHAADGREWFEHQALDGIEPIEQALAEACSDLGTLHLAKIVDRAHVDLVEHGHEVAIDPKGTDWAGTCAPAFLAVLDDAVMATRCSTTRGAGSSLRGGCPQGALDPHAIHVRAQPDQQSILATMHPLKTSQVDDERGLVIIVHKLHQG